MIGCAVSAQTLLHARVSRVPCPTHGIVQVNVTWAAPSPQFTAHFEPLVIDRRKEAAVACQVGRDTAHHAARGVSVSATLLPAGSKLSYIRGSCA